MTPEERLLNLPGGPSGLSDAELVSILVNAAPDALDGLGRTLDVVGGLRSLMTAPASELLLLGFPPICVARLLAAVELVCRAQRPNLEGRAIRSPKDIQALLAPSMALLDQECFVVVCLSRALQVLHIGVVTIGSTSQVIVDAPSLFRLALRHGATAVVVAHNHPSGQVEPSAQDVEVTLRLAQAGQVLGIPVLDHLILAGEDYTSLAEAAHLPGLLPEVLLAS
jgi:DNA repair protein RadC